RAFRARVKRTLIIPSPLRGGWRQSGGGRSFGTVRVKGPLPNRPRKGRGCRATLVGTPTPHHHRRTPSPLGGGSDKPPPHPPVVAIWRVRGTGCIPSGVPPSRSLPNNAMLAGTRRHDTDGNDRSGRRLQSGSLMQWGFT